MLQFKKNNKKAAKYHQDGHGAAAEDLYRQCEEHDLVQPVEEAALDTPNSYLPKHKVGYQDRNRFMGEQDTTATT